MQWGYSPYMSFYEQTGVHHDILQLYITYHRNLFRGFMD